MLPCDEYCFFSTCAVQSYIKHDALRNKVGKGVSVAESQIGSGAKSFKPPPPRKKVE